MHIAQGETMGTYYRLVTREAECSASEPAVSAELGKLNAQLSTYDPHSTISRINQATAYESILAPEHFQAVLVAADQVWHETEGAFDVTIGPLVNIWGFGPNQVTGDQVPDLSAQQEAASVVGMQHVSLAHGYVSKALDRTYIDFSALAKGYGVDVIAKLLLERGCRNFMVDIGGEIQAHGLSEHDRAWRLGIESPDSSQIGQIHRVLQLSNFSVATSGDYRNFRVVNGKRVAHVLDPRTGRPASNQVVSATVVHPSAMLADAYATALMVLGEEAGLSFAERLNLPVYIILAQPTDAESVWRVRYNSAMETFLIE
ncbi:MAG: FAD:protein FMN transferase [Pseudomonadota bacterium]